MDEVSTTGYAICCGMHMHSPQGDDIAIAMCPKTTLAVWLITFYDCMIANKSQNDPNLTKINNKI